MAESVDALVSNTSGAIRAGSIPAPGTIQSCKQLIFNAYRILLFSKTSTLVTFGHLFAKGDLKTPQNLPLLFVQDSYVVSFSWFA